MHDINLNRTCGRGGGSPRKGMKEGCLAFPEITPPAQADLCLLQFVILKEGISAFSYCDIALSLQW